MEKTDYEKENKALRSHFLAIYDNYKGSVFILQKEILLLANSIYESDLIDKTTLFDLLYLRICELIDASNEYINCINEVK